MENEITAWLSIALPGCWASWIVDSAGCSVSVSMAASPQVVHGAARLSRNPARLESRSAWPTHCSSAAFLIRLPTYTQQSGERRLFYHCWRIFVKTWQFVPHRLNIAVPVSRECWRKNSRESGMKNFRESRVPGNRDSREWTHYTQTNNWHAVHGYYQCNFAFTTARYILSWTTHMAANHFPPLSTEHCCMHVLDYFNWQNYMKYHWNDFSILACLLLYSYCTIICNGNMATSSMNQCKTIPNCNCKTERH